MPSPAPLSPLNPFLSCHNPQDTQLCSISQMERPRARPRLPHEGREGPRSSEILLQKHRGGASCLPPLNASVGLFGHLVTQQHAGRLISGTLMLLCLTSTSLTSTGSRWRERAPGRTALSRVTQLMSPKQRVCLCHMITQKPTGTDSPVGQTMRALLLPQIPLGWFSPSPQQAALQPESHRTELGAGRGLAEPASYSERIQDWSLL